MCPGLRIWSLSFKCIDRSLSYCTFGLLRFILPPMARPIVLFQIVQAPGGTPDQRSRRQLAIVEGDEVLLGREPPPGGITLPSSAVSRVHGLLRGVGQHWTYRDEGSTNGSWLNGEKVPTQVWLLIKPGDYLQLGDVAIEVEDAERRGSAEFDRMGFGIRSLLVFSREAFQSEYPVPEFGRALVVGGKNADLQLSVDMHDLPSLVVERRGESVAAFTISKDILVELNGQALSQTRVLQDRDELVVEHFRIIFNDVVSAKRSPSDSPDADRGRRGGESSRDLLGQGPAGDPRSAPPGQSPISANEAGTLSGASLAHASGAQGDAHSAGTFSTPSAHEQSTEGGWVEAARATRPSGGSHSANESVEMQASGDMAGDVTGGRRDPTRSFPWGEGEADDTQDAPPTPRHPDRLPFGKIGSLDDVRADQTVAIDPSLVRPRGGFDASGRSRYSSEVSEDEVSSSLEDKIWLTVGLLMVLALILMVVWWLLSR